MPPLGATHRLQIARGLLWVTSVALCNKRRPIDFRYAPLATKVAWRLQYVANGMDRPRSRPQRLSECAGACQEEERRHASQVHRSRNHHHRY